MADPALPAGSDALEEAIGRLSKKPGVKATIVLDRASGAIMKTSGQVSSIRANKPTASLSTQTSSFGTETSLQPPPSESDGAEEIASIVWNFVGTAGSLVEELDTEDELKLLRLRTKKQELVIVPDAKYLLIVVHDTPPA